MNNGITQDAELASKVLLCCLVLAIALLIVCTQIPL